MASLREIGQTLKEAREGQNLSLDEVSQRTRISLRHLMALEEGNEADLPEVFYVRGFIKKYAELVGLPPAELADAYRSAPIPQPAEVSPRFSVGPIAYYLLFALLIGGALALAWHFQPRVSVVAESPSPTPTATPTPTPAPATPSPAGSPAAAAASPGATVAPSPEASPAASPATSPAPTPTTTPRPTPRPTATAGATPTPRPTAKPTPRSTPKPAAQEKGVTLFIQERAWVEVLVDGQVAFEGLLLPGATRRFEGQSIEVTAGNAGGVRVSVNGQDRGVLGERGVVVTRTY